MKRLPADLIIFNKVFAALKGNGLLNFVELIGTGDQITEVVSAEKEFFSKHGISVTFLVSDQKISPNKNTVYFFPEGGCSGPCNQIDVSGVSVGVTYEDFCEMTGLSVDKNLFKQNIQPHLNEDTLKKTINDILLKHYSNGDFQDKTLRESDLPFNKNANKKQEPVVETVADVLLSEATTNDPAPESQETPKKIKDAPKEKDLNEEGMVKKMMENPLRRIREKAGLSTDDKDLFNGEKSAVVPEPKKITVNRPKNCKDVLTEEENIRNKELLNDIQVKYTEMVEFIESLCNPQWGTILNHMKDCKKNNLFNKQWCKMYLEVSDDVSTPLYAKLYELDNQTLQYNNEVVHQIKNLGCFNCGGTWEEDITFLEKGAHYIKCPHCGQNRGFEKE